MATVRKRDNDNTTTLINGGVTPVVYTDDGRVLGAGERVEVSSLDGTATAQVEHGYLTVDKGERDHDGTDTSGASAPETAS